MKGADASASGSGSEPVSTTFVARSAAEVNATTSAGAMTRHVPRGESETFNAQMEQRHRGGTESIPETRR